MRRFFKWLVALVAIVIVIFGVWIPATNWMHRSVAEKQLVAQSPMTPLIFVPGSSAGENRFDALIQQLDKQTGAHSVLKVTVQRNGKLKTRGTISARDQQPFIVVAFADNQDGYPNIKRQAKWFAAAMVNLRARYHFSHYSGIGHSNGSLVWTIYLEKYRLANSKMERLLTMGGPYNLEESNPNDRTQLLADLIAQRKCLPRSLSVDSIAGSRSFTGDGTVPLESVAAGRFIFQGQVRHFTQVTVSGQNASHSDLTTNPQVVQIIENNLLARRRP